MKRYLLRTLMAGSAAALMVGSLPATMAHAAGYDLQVTLTHTPDPVAPSSPATYTVYLQMMSDSTIPTGSDSVTAVLTVPGGSTIGSDTASSVGFTCTPNQPSAAASGMDTCTGTPNMVPCQTLQFDITVTYGAQNVGHQSPDDGVSVVPAADNTAQTGTDSVDSTYVLSAGTTPPSPAPQPNPKPAIPPANCSSNPSGGGTPSPAASPSPSPSGSQSASPSPGGSGSPSPSPTGSGSPTESPSVGVTPGTTTSPTGSQQPAGLAQTGGGPPNPVQVLSFIGLLALIILGVGAGLATHRIRHRLT